MITSQVQCEYKSLKPRFLSFPATGARVGDVYSAALSIIQTNSGHTWCVKCIEVSAPYFNTAAVFKPTDVDGLTLYTWSDKTSLSRLQV